MMERAAGKKEKLKKLGEILLVIWVVKIAACFGIREYQNSRMLSMYKNSNQSEYVLHIDREFHVFNWKYGVFGISYHYTIDVYDDFNPSEIFTTHDRGIFRISFLHYGYIQDRLPFPPRRDVDIISPVQEWE